MLWGPLRLKDTRNATKRGACLCLAFALCLFFGRVRELRYPLLSITKFYLGTEESASLSIETGSAAVTVFSWDDFYACL